MISLTLQIIGFLAIIVVYLLGRFLTLPHGPEEPPLVSPRIPWIGHMVGMLQNGTAYYSKLAMECKQPIFTLGLPRAKMYVVASPGLATACDKRAKTISFAPYVVEFGRRILLSSQHGISLLAEDQLEEKGPVTLRPQTMQAMHKSLQGEHLEETTRSVLKHISDFFDSGLSMGVEKGVPLFQWIRRFTTIASTNAIWGPEMNPMQDLSVSNGFWAVDKDFALLGLMMYPDLIARQGNRGRQRFFNAFRKYYTTGWQDNASHMTKARYEVNTRHGVSDDDIAQYDLGVCTALLVNTVPAVFWTLCHVFSDQSLLAELRHGIETIYPLSKLSKNTKCPATVSVNIAHVVDTCPLIVSLVQEVLRLQSTTASARYLLRDTLIDDGEGRTYLLKKDAMLVMPAVPLHKDQAVWGPAAQTFDPARFLTPQGRKVHASANRTFGGGNALCPGRHLAVREIVSILTVIVLKYDIEPLDRVWKIPKARNHIATSIRTPVKDVWVSIHPRQEVKDIKLDFVWKAKAKA